MKQLVIRAKLNGDVIGLGSSYILYHKMSLLTMSQAVSLIGLIL